MPDTVLDSKADGMSKSMTDIGGQVCMQCATERERVFLSRTTWECDAAVKLRVRTVCTHTTNVGAGVYHLPQLACAAPAPVAISHPHTSYL